MNRRIKLSATAKKKLSVLLEYLEEEWSAKAKIDFIQKLDKSLNQISRFPNSNPKSTLVKDLHKCVVTRQTILFYKFSENEVFVVTIIDSRRDPDSLRQELLK